MKKKLTNIKAIDLVSDMVDLMDKTSMVASVFAKEDIIEFDVNTWVDIPTHELLPQFKEHSIEAVKGYIDEAAENDGHLRFKKEMHNLHGRCMDLVDTTIEYSRMHHEIKSMS